MPTLLSLKGLSICYTKNAETILQILQVNNKTLNHWLHQPYKDPKITDIVTKTLNTIQMSVQSNVFTVTNTKRRVDPQK